MADSNVDDIKKILSTVDPSHVSVTEDGKIHILDTEAASAFRALPFAESFDDDSTNAKSFCVNVMSC